MTEYLRVNFLVTRYEADMNTQIFVQLCDKVRFLQTHRTRRDFPQEDQPYDCLDELEHHSQAVANVSHDNIPIDPRQLVRPAKLSGATPLTEALGVHGRRLRA